MPIRFCLVCGIAVTVHSIDAVRLWPGGRRFYARFAHMRSADLVMPSTSQKRAPRAG